MAFFVSEAYEILPHALRVGIRLVYNLYKGPFFPDWPLPYNGPYTMYRESEYGPYTTTGGIREYKEKLV